MGRSMTWYEMLGLAAAYLVPLITLIIHLHSRTTKAREDFRSDIESQMSGLISQTRKDHEAVRNQITDLVRSISEGYIRTREFESSVHGINESITQARREIGAVGNQVTEVTRRVDRLIDTRANKWSD